MFKPLPKAFTVLLVIVLLLCSATVVGSIFYQANMQEQITQAQANLNTAQGRLRKQQAEFAEYTEALPQVLAQLEELQPLADEAYAQEQTLRQQRKDLRAENSGLADELALLLNQVEAASTEASSTAQAILQLQQSLDALEDIQALFD